jgi:hypothetical protein
MFDVLSLLYQTMTFSIPILIVAYFERQGDSMAPQGRAGDELEATKSARG